MQASCKLYLLQTEAYLFKKRQIKKSISLGLRRHCRLTSRIWLTCFPQWNIFYVILKCRTTSQSWQPNNLHYRNELLILHSLNFIVFVLSSIMENEDRKEASPYCEKQFPTLHLGYQLTLALQVVVTKMEVADVLLSVWQGSLSLMGQDWTQSPSQTHYTTKKIRRSKVRWGQVNYSLIKLTDVSLHR